MSWVTVIWSMIASACLTLALLHVVIWIKQRSSIAPLLFSFSALGVAGIGCGEMMMMHARTPEQFGLVLRWTHVPLFLAIVSIVGFVRVYMRAGRRWLAWTVCALRVLVLVINFSVSSNLNYKQIIALKQLPLWNDENVVVPIGIASGWTRLGAFSSLLFMVFVVDASISAWRRGNPIERRRALGVGGSLAFFVVAGTLHTLLIHGGVIESPYLISLPFLVPLAVMGYELGMDVVRSSRFSLALEASRAELQQSNERFRLVVEASPSAMIMINARSTIELVNIQAEVVFGYTRRELVGQPLDMLISERSRADLAEYRRPCVGQAEDLRTSGRELYGLHKTGTEFPVEISVRPVQMPDKEFVLVSLIDISERQQTERAAARQRDELAHLARVTMLGELSGSLAHELNQPLTAILSNAQAAQRFLTRDEIDLDEVRSILKDIVSEDKRAGDVIRALRLLFKKGEAQKLPLDMNDVVLEVLKFLNSDLLNHMVSARVELSSYLPPVWGDRVQLQQVLINLIVNGCDAMTATDPGDRKLLVRTRRRDGEGIRISVIDHGCGIPPDRIEEVFEPFVTTKMLGMGLGLTVCRTIIAAHEGKLWATNNTNGGASFHITIPANGEAHHESR
jgi:PAS domain S-box-containing protein